MELLKRLSQAQGVAGYEKEVRSLIKEEIKGYADEITTDAIGNLIAIKYGKGENKKKIMLAAHMDEIGYQVTKIEADGRIKVCNLGWTWAGAAYNSRVKFRNGVIGVVGCEGSIEDAKNSVNKLFIDIGCKSKEETIKYVNIGDVCGFIGEYNELKNDHICSKSLDDRLGCYLLIEALKKNDGNTPNDVYYVFTVQEELGCRGSKVTAQRICPDIGIAVDITPAHDYPCDLQGSNSVGGGVAIKFSDPSVVCDEYLVSKMIECCQKNNISYQHDVIDKGGTDASSMNMACYGTKVAGVSVVTRYPHSQSAVISKGDLEAALNLLVNYTAMTFKFED